jgi:hypothetical protein
MHIDKLASEAAIKYFKENIQLNKKLDVVRDTFVQQTKIVARSCTDIPNGLTIEETHT